MKNLYYKILRLDKKKYGAYKTLKGTYDNGGVELEIFHVQGDPYAQPSRLIYRIPREQTNLDSKYWSTPEQRIACADFIHRVLFQKMADGFQIDLREGPQMGPYLKTPEPCEAILPRTAVLLTDTGIEFRLFAGLPGQGRLIEAKPCAEMICEQLPSLCGSSCLLDDNELQSLQRHIDVYLKQEFLRQALVENQWIVFIEEGSILPRVTGQSSHPLAGAVPFSSPSEHRVSLQSPWGELTGMALPTGVHLIVGGAFQGKSTLLEALKVGIYNHIPGDGREGIVVLSSTVELQSENGRSVREMNLSPFFHKTRGFNAEKFQTLNASGSTSQAASFIEALQFGSELLLLDEDECSVNFLYKDHTMKQLIGEEQDALVPLLDVLPQVRSAGVSLILVAGASGEYFRHADRVLMADAYQYLDVTEKAKSLNNTPLFLTQGNGFNKERQLYANEIISAMKGAQKVSRPRYKELAKLDWCNQKVDGSALETLICPEQIHSALKALQKWSFQNTDKGDVKLSEAVREIQQLKLKFIDDGGAPDLAMFAPGDFWRIWFRTPQEISPS